MINCDGCGRLIKTTEIEIEGDIQHFCKRCLEWYNRTIPENPLVTLTRQDTMAMQDRQSVLDS